MKIILTQLLKTLFLISNIRKGYFLKFKNFCFSEISEDVAESPSSKSVTNEASSATTTTTTLWARPSGRGTSRSAATTSAAAAGGAGGPPGYHRRGSLQVLTLATIFVVYLVCLLQVTLLFRQKHSKYFFVVFIKKNVG
jgi:hypothetical protein